MSIKNAIKDRGKSWLMNKYDEIRKNINISCDKAKNSLAELSYNSKEVEIECKRVAEISKNVNIIIPDINRQFASATKLNKVDISFLFFATALQCLRQYLLTDFKDRVDDEKAAKNTKGKEKESSDRKHRLYTPSLEQIISNPVPFDAIYGSRNFDLGLSGNNHRAKTLGHDPLLGWVFGTANIATSTMTMWNMQSYHVKTGFTINNHKRDLISSNADTTKVFSYTTDKLLNQGMSGKSIIGASIVKEAIHLKSDIGSKKSLPFPIVSTISPDLADELAKYGIDTGNLAVVGMQAGLSILINTLVAMIHRLIYDEGKHSSISLYEVRTRNILLYSNVIASLSNVLVVAIGSAIGVASENPDMVRKSLQKLDIGGLVVTLYRLISDVSFINKIKREFLENEFYDRVMGTDFSFVNYNDEGELIL